MVSRTSLMCDHARRHYADAARKTLKLTLHGLELTLTMWAYLGLQSSCLITCSVRYQLPTGKTAGKFGGDKTLPLRKVAKSLNWCCRSRRLNCVTRCLYELMTSSVPSRVQGSRCHTLSTVSKVPLEVHPTIAGCLQR